MPRHRQMRRGHHAIRRDLRPPRNGDVRSRNPARFSGGPHCRWPALPAAAPCQGGLPWFSPRGPTCTHGTTCRPAPALGSLVEGAPRLGAASLGPPVGDVSGDPRMALPGLLDRGTSAPRSLCPARSSDRDVGRGRVAPLLTAGAPEHPEATRPASGVRSCAVKSGAVYAPAREPYAMTVTDPAGWRRCRPC